MPLVSIIIPNYNGHPWLDKTLDSCLGQIEFLKEIIVVDDFSTDQSWELLEGYQAKFPGLIWPVRNTDKGGNAARNLGFSLSTGEYIQWLDSDDQILPGKFEHQLAAFKTNKMADIVYSDWQLDTYNEERQLIRTEYKKQRAYHDFLFELLIDNWSCPHNYLIKRNFAEKLSKLPAWNPMTKAFQDREYFTLAAIHGAHFMYIPGNFSVYNRWSKNSVSQNHEAKQMILSKLFFSFERQIETLNSMASEKKKYYSKVIKTLQLMDQISTHGIKNPRGELRFGNIYWPALKTSRAKLKMFAALACRFFYA